MKTILKCENITKSYGTKVALDGVSFSIEEGQIVGLLGPNGSGKTTLIKLINGLLTPNEGSLMINGNAPGVETKKVISYLPDRDFLPKSETINAIIAYYEMFFEDFRTERAREMLASLNLDPKVKIKTLSKGNREKVALILVMSRDADLYILDEPIAGVDPAARDFILNTIITNYNEKASILLSTHLISDVEPILSDVMFINEGKIFAKGNADEVRAKRKMSIDAIFREVFKC